MSLPPMFLPIREVYIIGNTKGFANHSIDLPSHRWLPHTPIFSFYEEILVSLRSLGFLVERRSDQFCKQSKGSNGIEVLNHFQLVVMRCSLIAHGITSVSPTFNNLSSSPQILPSLSHASLNRVGGSVTSSKYWLIPPLTVP